ncbi:MAG: hypothetical protein ACE5KV_02525 [Thermoplasmata archaeon]
MVNDVNFNASSSLFQCPEGGIFTRENLGLRVRELLKGDHPTDINLNIGRTRAIAFEEIRKRYNRRIERWKLKFKELRPSDESDLEVISVKYGDSMSHDTVCGRFSIFPTTFVCGTCGDFLLLNERDMYDFDPDRCHERGCKGRYEQVSVVKFCETCGLVDQLFYRCKNHADHRIKLDRPIEDEPSTWKFRCSICGTTLDFLAFTCKHSPRPGADTVTAEPPSRFVPITVQEGGVYSPQVLSLLQVPSLRIPDDIRLSSSDEQYLLLALCLGRLSEVFGQKGLGSATVETVCDAVSFHFNSIAKRRFIRRENLEDMTQDEQEEKWKEYTGWKEIESILEELKKEYPLETALNILEYASLAGTLAEGKRNVSFDGILREDTGLSFEKRMALWEEIKNRYHLKSVSYVGRITISNALIGHINGFVRPWEENYVPHFEPLWVRPEERKGLKTYLYSYETEGLLFQFDIESILRWLEANDVSVSHKKTPAETLHALTPESDAYEKVETLLHTLAHTLIATSEVFTGLSRDSLSEILFPGSGAIFLYSTSQINVGSFKYVFEHNMFDWLSQVEFEVMDCTFDPACIESRGACFSCLYLPEFVCCMFNASLDRESLKGGNRFEEGFWYSR